MMLLCPKMTCCLRRYHSQATSSIEVEIRIGTAQKRPADVEKNVIKTTTMEGTPKKSTQIFPSHFFWFQYVSICFFQFFCLVSNNLNFVPGPFRQARVQGLVQGFVRILRAAAAGLGGFIFAFAP